MRQPEKLVRLKHNQAFNAIFIPNPTALEIRQLKNAVMAVFKKFVQVKRVCLKR
jgi:hypothetical protein